MVKKIQVDFHGRPLSNRRSAGWRSRPTAPRWSNTARPVVLVTAVAAKEVRAEADFFPLTVDYQERHLRRR
jgi:polyribonucleotide nucleotidyltransferase